MPPRQHRRLRDLCAQGSGRRSCIRRFGRSQRRACAFKISRCARLSAFGCLICACLLMCPASWHFSPTSLLSSAPTSGRIPLLRSLRSLPPLLPASRLLTRLASLHFIIIVRFFSGRIVKPSHASLFFGNSGTLHPIASPLRPLLEPAKLPSSTSTPRPFGFHCAWLVSILIHHLHLQATRPQRLFDLSPTLACPALGDYAAIVPLEVSLVTRHAATPSAMVG